MARGLGLRDAHHVGVVCRALQRAGAIAIAGDPGGPCTYRVLRSERWSFVSVAAGAACEVGDLRWRDLAVLGALETLGPKLGRAGVLEVTTVQRAVADLCGRTVRTVQRVLIDVRDAGLLWWRGNAQRTGRDVWRTANTYYLHFRGERKTDRPLSARARSWRNRRQRPGVLATAVAAAVAARAPPATA